MIEDSGRFNNPYDKIDLNEITPYGIDVLEDLGYSKIRLTMNIDMKEKIKVISIYGYILNTTIMMRTSCGEMF